MRLQILMSCLLVSCGPAARAADSAVEVLSLAEGASPPAAGIGEIAWLAGHWTGTGFGGVAEDFISAPSDGQMMGMFRHLKADGSINFYEFYVFAEKDGSLTQRLKHFSPMLAGWEEKDGFVEFPLVELSEHAAYFDGLTYLLGEDGGLTVGVRVEEDRVAVFHYRRVE